MSMDLISVIIPAYNIEQYIGKCVESVIKQSYTEMEVILVDDGSTDGTSEICDKYAIKDDRIKVIHRKNGGLSAARNSGIDAARGKYLYFVDGDDMIHIDCIGNMVRLMKQEDCDIVQCKTYAFLNENKIPMALPHEEIKIYTGKEMCECLMFGKYGSDTTVVWNKLYKKKVFNTARFKEGMVYEDVAIMHELFWNAYKVVVTNLPLAFYRSMRTGSITHSGNKRYGDCITADWMQICFFRENKAQRLMDQGLYILSNDMARFRIYRNNEDNVFLKKKHRKAVREASKAKISVLKKVLINIGYVCPKGWYAIWSLRRKIKGKIEWWKKGEHI